MNNWLQNIKGQIHDLASEVLQDVTTEIEDPETELQVEKKKSNESEKLLVVEKSKNQILEGKIKELEDQVFSTNIENEAVRDRFANMIQERDSQIRQLQSDVEFYRLQVRSSDGFEDVDIDNLGSSFNQRNISSDVFQLALAEEVAKLKEVHESEKAELSRQFHSEFEQKLLERTRILNYQTNEMCIQTQLDEANKEIQNETIARLTDELRSQVEENQKLKTLISSISSNNSRPFSDNEDGGDSSSSNNDWERMGADCSGKSNKESGVVLQQVSDNNSQFEKMCDSFKISDLHAEFSEGFLALNETRNSLREALDENKRLISSFDDETSKMKAQVIKKEEEIENLKENSKLNEKIHEEDLAKMKLEIDFLKERIEELNNSSVQEVDESSNVKETLMSELETLKRENYELIESKTIITQLRDHLQSKNEEFEQLKHILKCENEQKIVELNSEWECKMNLSYQQHAIEHEENSKSFENLNQTVAHLESQLRLKDELLNKLNQKEKTVVIQTNSAVQKDEEEYDARTVEVNILKQQLDEAFHRCNELAQNEFLLTEETDSLKRQLRELSEHSDNLIRKEESQNQFFNEQLAYKDAEAAEIKSKLLLEEEARLSFFSIEKQLKEEIERLKFELEINEEQQASNLKNEKNFAVTQTDNELNQEANQFQALLNVSVMEKNELLEQLDFKAKEIERCNVNLQELSASHNECESKIRYLTNEVFNAQQEFTKKDEVINKLNAELIRLRDHLMTVEEISSREAIASEERETELRKIISTLNSSVAVSPSEFQESHLEDEIITLKAEIVSLEETNSHLRSSLHEKEGNVAECIRSLSNLQRVLKDLDEDQRREKENYGKEIKMLKEKNERQTKEVEQLSQVERNFNEKQQDFDLLIQSKDTELKKMKSTIEELENRLEDLSHSKTNRFSLQPSAESSYRIDDATLRHLFISFFTSEKSKQPEIAVVMSKILGYSLEEQSQIREAVEKTWGPTSWLGFLSRASNKQPESLSLTEQFIRFLEQESRVAEKRVLPVHHEAAESDRITVDAQPSFDVLDGDRYSHSDLKFIIES